MNESRIPLGFPSEPRDETLTKDNLLTNCFIEQTKVGSMYAVKRPGFVVGTEGITTPLETKGIFYHNGTVYYIDENNTLQGFLPPSSYYSSYYVVTNVEDFV